MKLTELRRTIQEYEFRLIENSWVRQLPAHQTGWRKVGKVQTTKFSLLTKAHDSEDVYLDSWIYFPRVKETIITQIKDGYYFLTIKRHVGNDKPPHVMVYEFRKKQPVEV